MLKWAFVFLLIAIVAGIFGFTGVEGSGVQRMAVVRLQGDRIFRNGFDGS